MFELGQLIMIELSVVDKMKDMDLSMQVGQEFLAIVGVCEKEIANLRKAASIQGPLPLNPLPNEGPK